tara:strand:+ start:2609 stop:2764 length:156 start_codon:yes stop_codon:yes gene_type:complete
MYLLAALIAITIGLAWYNVYQWARGTRERYFWSAVGVLIGLTATAVVAILQ